MTFTHHCQYHMFTQVSTCDNDTHALVHLEKGPIQVHLSCVCPCSPLLPAGFYWYDGNCRCPGRVPQWVDRLLQDGPLGHVPEEDNQNAGDSKQSLSVPDEDRTEDDQPVDVTPHYNLRDHSTIVPPARLMTIARNELLPGGSDVTLLLTLTIRSYMIVVSC